MKKQISRKCIATNKVIARDNLIRIVKTKSGEYFVDSNEKGRGAYISNDPALLDKLLKQRLLNRTFKENVPKEVYDELEKRMRGKDGE